MVGTLHAENSDSVDEGSWGQARRPSKPMLRRAGSIKSSLRLSSLGVVCYSAKLTDTVVKDRALTIQLIYKNIC